MGIIDRLKKEKKSGSVLDALVKKKEDKEEAKKEVHERPSDIEVRELTPSGEDDVVTPEDIDMQPVEMKSVREFRTEGMHEFELDSLGASTDAGIKAEYKSKVSKLVDENKIDEAISLLQKLKQKLAEQHK